MAIRNRPINNHLAGIFQEKTVPAAHKLAGWAALSRHSEFRPPSADPSVVSEQHVKASRREEGGWTSSTSDTGLASPSATRWDSRCAMKTSICSS